jgi:hypothetical protein
LYAHFRTAWEREKRILMKELYKYITIQIAKANNKIP